jgi:Tfp pilus assembly protein PilZ
MGGMLIETSTPLSVGQELTLVFSFDENRDPFKVKGRVVWSGPRGAGIKFIQLSNFQKNILKTTVDHLGVDRSAKASTAGPTVRNSSG